jgi:VanZ family protein
MAVIAVGSSALFDGERTAGWARLLLGLALPGAGPDTLDLLHAALRKLGHVVEFGVLAVLWRRALAPAPRAVVRAFAVAAAYGLLDELRQGLAPTRVPAATDVVLDAAGALLGLAAWEGPTALPGALRRAAAAGAALAAGLAVAFLALEWALGRAAWELAPAAAALALAAWGLVRAGGGAWRRRP